MAAQFKRSAQGSNEVKRLGYAVLALVIIILGINEFVRVTPNDEGIIWFWISQKLSSPAAPHVQSGWQESSRWSEQERFEVLSHMTFSMESSAAAEEILRNRRENGQQITNEDIQNIIAKINHAVSEASMVSDQALRKIHPMLPTQFREKYQAGLSSIARGLANGEKEEMARGTELYGEFKSWGMKHAEKFTYPPE